MLWCCDGGVCGDGEPGWLMVLVGVQSRVVWGCGCVAGMAAPAWVRSWWLVVGLPCGGVANAVCEKLVVVGSASGVPAGCRVLACGVSLCLGVRCGGCAAPAACGVWTVSESDAERCGLPDGPV